MTGEGKTTFSREDAQAWCAGMQNADGSTGPHWSLENAGEIMQKYGLSYSLYEFWAAINASYSDLCTFFKKYNIDALDTYIDYVKTFWFEDKDAVADRLGAYYKAVVKR